MADEPGTQITTKSLELIFFNAPVPRAKLATIFSAQSAELTSRKPLGLEPEPSELRKSHGTGVEADEQRNRSGPNHHTDEVGSRSRMLYRSFV